MPRSKQPAASAGRKRKNSSSQKKELAERKKKARIHIPKRIQRKVNEIVDQVLNNEGVSVDNSDESTATNNQQEQLNSFQSLLETKLDLEHLDSDALQHIFSSSNSNNNDCKILSEALQTFAVNSWHQQQLAFQVFYFMDQGGKGVVVLEDLQQVAGEFLNDSGGDAAGEIDLEELEDMMALAGSSTSDGLLSKEDFVKIARKVNLQTV
mmetsp:Transcript_20909/g.27016  ORF Transcript_20909/g.27016 Transcript_20909/m.27016 type:complete len:209 (+) Transcript_20909:171-797(+)|eukprot:CAMPEP_0198145926 /NCGR_PEP_ID=MMETSP1443-20131203/26159_1 /TAXON_ID=186043 /ORGANISM="Entomoneis sp., Strain CCMP2396" /LENGTH=208 /DNA_ID=CAMNT_0043809689 /DNA_START=125 /DNA_END=751 /DNA_ORIENTATION=+